MPVEPIDENLCNGCKLCVDVCPMDVLRFDEVKNKAYVKYQQDCMVCLICELRCPTNAIYVSPKMGTPVGYLIGFERK